MQNCKPFDVSWSFVEWDWNHLIPVSNHITVKHLYDIQSAMGKISSQRNSSLIFLAKWVPSCAWKSCRESGHQIPVMQSVLNGEVRLTPILMTGCSRSVPGSSFASHAQYKIIAHLVCRESIGEGIKGGLPLVFTL